MKKIITVLALCLSFSTGFAQFFAPDKTPVDSSKIFKNRRGRAILPAKGDLALGFNAVPVFNFLFNLPNSIYNGTTNVGSIVGYASTSNSSNNQIVGKYYLDAKTAIRVRVGLNTLSGSITNPVQNSAAMATALQGGNPIDIQNASSMKVNDKLNFSKSVTMMSVGYEKRRGYGRIQGFYGAEFMIGCAKNNTNVSYGNAFSDVTQAVYTTNFNTGSTNTLNPATATPVSRNTDTTHTSAWTFGLRAFVGVEYFIFPKISIGAEFGWAYAIQRQRGYTVTNETYYNGAAGAVDVVQKTNVGAPTTLAGSAIDNNNNHGSQPFSLSSSVRNTGLNGASGAIILLFHF